MAHAVRLLRRLAVRKIEAGVWQDGLPRRPRAARNDNNCEIGKDGLLSAIFSIRVSIDW